MLSFIFIFMMVADVVTEFIEGLVETYPGLQYLDGFPEVMIFSNFSLYAMKLRPSTLYPKERWGWRFMLREVEIV